MIKDIRELRQKSSLDMVHGSTLEVTFDLEGTGMSYKTATNLAVFPQNSAEDVKLCADLLGYKLDQAFVFKANPNAQSKRAAKHPFPTPTTVEEALKRYVDLRGALRKKLLTDLAGFATDPQDK